MSPLYQVPTGASPIHQTAAQYINGWNTLDLDAMAATFDDDAFKWTMYPIRLQIPAMDKKQSVAYLKNVFLPTMDSFTFTVLSLTEPNDHTAICHLTGEGKSKLGNVLKNEYFLVLEFVASSGGLPKISNYTEFMDSQAVVDFEMAEKKAKA